jgi:hypothetical protein
MKKRIVSVTFLLLPVALLILGTYFVVIRPRVSVGMSQQEVQTRLKPSSLPFLRSTLTFNDRLGVYFARRSFLITTQEVIVRVGTDGTVQNTQSKWSWRF